MIFKSASDFDSHQFSSGDTVSDVKETRQLHTSVPVTRVLAIVHTSNHIQKHGDVLQTRSLNTHHYVL